MTLSEIRRSAIEPALLLLPAKMTSPQAEVMLLTTHLQEAPGREQCQLPGRPGKCGPARGIFQFERGGGVAGVLRHPASRPHVFTVCAKLGVLPTLDGIFDALPTQCDVLDAALARLLYWTDRDPLPDLGDVDGALQSYLHNWRPGAYARGDSNAKATLRRKWANNYARALTEVTG